MKDNEIISLFEMRDEHAIKALSDKYHQQVTEQHLRRRAGKVVPEV